MFTTLVASNWRSRRRTLTPGTLLLSSALHGALLVGALYASVRPPEKPETPTELVTFLDMNEPAEPPPPMDATAPAPPVGAPAFVPPIDPPPFIPAPDPSQLRIDLALYTGDIPTIDGPVTPPSDAGSSDVLPGEQEEHFTYRIEVLDSAPVVTNRDAVKAFMQREYPPTFANAGIYGEVIAEFVVLPNGTVDLTTAKIVSATHDGFATATLNVLGRLRFRPGRYRGEAVRVLTRMPVQWRVGG